MKKRIVQLIPTIIVLLGIGFRYFSIHCIDNVPSCYSSWINGWYAYFTGPLYIFCLYALPLTIVLIFISPKVFKSWLKLAAWMLPLAFIFVATQPVSWSGMSLNFFFISRDDMGRYTAEIFTVVSLILIIWKYVAARRKSSVKA